MMICIPVEMIVLKIFQESQKYSSGHMFPNLKLFEKISVQLIFCKYFPEFQMIVRKLLHSTMDVYSSVPLVGITVIYATKWMQKTVVYVIQMSVYEVLI